MSGIYLLNNLVNWLPNFSFQYNIYIENINATASVTVVDIIGEEKIEACQKITDEIGVTLRVRPFEE